MTLTEFLEKHKPGFKSSQVPFRPGMQNWHRDSYHFLYQLTYQDRSFVGFFSMGPGNVTIKFKGSQFERKIPPVATLAEILTCLQSDCQFGEMAKTECLAELGDNSVWEDCRNLRDSLIDLFGRGPYNDLVSITFDE